MSGPYCKTCGFYRIEPCTQEKEGTCNDPTKIISWGKGDRVNGPPWVRESMECMNHESKGENDA